jgi:hypothetical protein
MSDAEETTDTSAAFKRVISGILSFRENSQPWRALMEGDVLDIPSFLVMDEDAICALSYTDDDGLDVALKRNHCMKLLALPRWVNCKGDSGTDEATWLSLTKKEMETFFNSPAARTPMNQACLTPPVMSVPPVVVDEAAVELEMFQKGIRRDPKDYNALEDQSKFLQWKRHVVTTAKAHGVYNVLDESYVPATPKAEQLLTAQSQFLYKVFESTVKLSQGA